MRSIPSVRFNALASYCRLPQASLCAEELKWLTLRVSELRVISR